MFRIAAQSPSTFFLFHSGFFFVGEKEKRIVQIIEQHGKACVINPETILQGRGLETRNKVQKGGI